MVCHRLTRQAPVGALALFLLLVGVYVASIDIRATRGASITGDEPFYLLTTQSLLQDGDLDLRQQYQRRSYESFFDHPQGLWSQSVARADGPLLSPHNPGLSVLLLPGFGAAGLRGAQTQLLVLAALTFALTYALVARLTGAPPWSWVTTMLVALCATPFIYATEVYPEVPAALALVAALLLLQDEQRPGVWRTLGLAGCLSALVWLGVKYAPLAGLVALWGLWRMAARERLTFLAVSAVNAVLFVGFHLRVFGALTPYSVGVVYAGDTTLAILGEHLSLPGRAYRLLGLFVDQRFGVGRWAPVLLPAAPALALLWRPGRRDRLVLALVTAQSLVATFVAITMMGWWFPGRTLMVVLPLLALPLTRLMVRLPGWGRLSMGLLGVYSLAITVVLARAGQAGEVVIAVDPFDLKSAVFQGTAWLFPNYTFWDLETWGLTVGWLALAGVSALVLFWKSRPPLTAPDPDSAGGNAGPQ